MSSIQQGLGFQHVALSQSCRVSLLSRSRPSDRLTIWPSDPSLWRPDTRKLLRKKCSLRGSLGVDHPRACSEHPIITERSRQTRVCHGWQGSLIQSSYETKGPWTLLIFRIFLHPNSDLWPWCHEVVTQCNLDPNWAISEWKIIFEAHLPCCQQGKPPFIQKCSLIICIYP